jgi:divalent metal cation (Fe/Co/Zn/Cd) transporter
MKTREAERISSPALRGNAACSLTCVYMAGALLLGLAVTTVLGWWWADGVAAIALLLAACQLDRDTLTQRSQ